MSLLSERDGEDRGLFTLQSPLHFLFHSQAEEAAGLCAVCLYWRERQIEKKSCLPVWNNGLFVPECWRRGDRKGAAEVQSQE